MQYPIPYECNESTVDGVSISFSSDVSVETLDCMPGATRSICPKTVDQSERNNNANAVDRGLSTAGLRRFSCRRRHFPRLQYTDWRPSIERAKVAHLRYEHRSSSDMCTRFIYGPVMVGKPITLKRRSRHRNIGECQVQT
jgi:hypothetical protein